MSSFVYFLFSETSAFVLVTVWRPTSWNAAISLLRRQSQRSSLRLRDLCDYLYSFQLLELRHVPNVLFTSNCSPV
ncbi:hypothetical protein RB195_021027 [Necator americanus]|uniref:Secreted protein n=1 Tax=Necator americanus TaxID=51031 RepID=A0ABR1CPH2_NECAM